MDPARCCVAADDQGRLSTPLSDVLNTVSLSRGAAFCSFNDSNPAAVRVIQRNIRDCCFEKHSKVTCTDYTMCVKMIERESKKPDLVFLDPPYRKGLAEDALALLAPILEEGALVAVETGSDETISFAGLALRKEYRQGTVKITLLEKRRKEEE